MSRWTTEAFWLGHTPRAGEAGAAVDPLADFDAWCAARAGRRVVVWVGSAWQMPLLVGPDVPLQDEAALRAWARRVLLHYGVGVDAPLATWRSGPRWGAVALVDLDLTALQAVAARHRVRLAGVRPGWALALQQLCRREPGLRRGRRRVWLHEPGLRTALSIEDGRLAAIESHWMHDGDTFVPAPAEPAFDVGTAPLGGGPLRIPDFLAAPVRRESTAGWVLAATGAVVLAVAVADHVAMPVTPAPSADVEGQAVAAPVDPGAVRWSAQAAHPWERVFTAAESASLPGVQWVQLEHDAQRRQLQLTGRAADIPQALAAAQQLSAAQGVAAALLSDARADAGGAGVRFVLQAQLADAPGGAEVVR